MCWQLHSRWTMYDQQLGFKQQCLNDAESLQRQMNQSVGEVVSLKQFVLSAKIWTPTQPGDRHQECSPGHHSSVRRPLLSVTITKQVAGSYIMYGICYTKNYSLSKRRLLYSIWHCLNFEPWSRAQLRPVLWEIRIRNIPLIIESIHRFQTFWCQCELMCTRMHLTIYNPVIVYMCTRYLWVTDPLWYSLCTKIISLTVSLWRNDAWSRSTCIKHALSTLTSSEFLLEAKCHKYTKEDLRPVHFRCLAGNARGSAQLRMLFMIQLRSQL